MYDSNILSWIDYSFVALTLIISTIVGSIFACLKTPNASAGEYLDGGQNLKLIPVTISICASVVSSVGVLGVVAEMYEFGVHHLIGTLLIMVSAIVALKFYIPVFYNLRITSMYEYLEMRFDRRIRLFTSFLFIVEAILVSSTVAYCSALALSKMSGIHIHYINIVLSSVCILYTMLGGIKGVIWTDTLQAWIMVSVMIFITITAIKEVGGIGEVMDITLKSDHLKLDFTLSPFVRYSVLSAIIGTWWMFFGMCFITQSNIQRFNALPDLPSAKKACIYVALGSIFLLLLSHICGIVLHALYYGCDPVVTGKIKKTEEVLPLFIIQHATEIPGFAGLFLAGLLSAGLSTISAKLNSASGVIYHDFIKEVSGEELNDKLVTVILKVGVVGIGLLSLAMGFLIHQMGQIAQLAISLQSICYGPILGLYTLGILVPQCSTKGAYAGAIAGLVSLLWICSGNQVAIANGDLKFPKLLGTTEGCTEFNMTSPSSRQVPETDTFILYQLSFAYFSLLGSVITIIVGWCTSYWTGFEDLEKLDLRYVAPCLQSWLQSKQKKCPPKDPEILLNLLNRSTVVPA